MPRKSDQYSSAAASPALQSLRESGGINVNLTSQQSSPLDLPHLRQPLLQQGRGEWIIIITIIIITAIIGVIILASLFFFLYSSSTKKTQQNDNTKQEVEQEQDALQPRAHILLEMLPYRKKNRNNNDDSNNNKKRNEQLENFAYFALYRSGLSAASLWSLGVVSLRPPPAYTIARAPARIHPSLWSLGIV